MRSKSARQIILFFRNSWGNTDTLYENTDPRKIAAQEAAANRHARENASNAMGVKLGQILSLV